MATTNQQPQSAGTSATTFQSSDATALSMLTTGDCCCYLCPLPQQQNYNPGLHQRRTCAQQRLFAHLSEILHFISVHAIQPDTPVLPSTQVAVQCSCQVSPVPAGALARYKVVRLGPLVGLVAAVHQLAQLVAEVWSTLGTQLSKHAASMQASTQDGRRSNLCGATWGKPHKSNHTKKRRCMTPHTNLPAMHPCSTSRFLNHKRCRSSDNMCRSVLQAGASSILSTFRQAHEQVCTFVCTSAFKQAPPYLQVLLQAEVSPSLQSLS